MLTHIPAFIVFALGLAIGIGFGLLVAYLARRHRGTSTMTIIDGDGNSKTTRYRAVTQRIPKAELEAMREKAKQEEDQ